MGNSFSAEQNFYSLFFYYLKDVGVDFVLQVHQFLQGNVIVIVFRLLELLKIEPLLLSFEIVLHCFAIHFVQTSSHFIGCGHIVDPRPSQSAFLIIVIVHGQIYLLRLLIVLLHGLTHHHFAQSVAGLETEINR